MRPLTNFEADHAYSLYLEKGHTPEDLAEMYGVTLKHMTKLLEGRASKYGKKSTPNQHSTKSALPLSHTARFQAEEIRKKYLNSQLPFSVVAEQFKTNKAIAMRILVNKHFPDPSYQVPMDRLRDDFEKHFHKRLKERYRGLVLTSEEYVSLRQQLKEPQTPRLYDKDGTAVCAIIIPRYHTEHPIFVVAHGALLFTALPAFAHQVREGKILSGHGVAQFNTLDQA